MNSVKMIFLVILALPTVIVPSNGQGSSEENKSSSERLETCSQPPKSQFISDDKGNLFKIINESAPDGRYFVAFIGESKRGYFDPQTNTFQQTGNLQPEDLKGLLVLTDSEGKKYVVASMSFKS